MTERPRITICVPCFGRPQRTARLINNLIDQDMNGWEAYIVGDDCKYFQKLMDDGVFAQVAKSEKSKGNKLVFSNLPMNQGGWGYAIRNKVKELASGKYFIYIDNDDWVEKDHLSHYLSEIEGTDLDFVYYNTLIKPTNTIRDAKLLFGHIGHSELIIRTDFLKEMPPHGNQYGHDWELVFNMMRLGAKHKKAESTKTTYHIMGVGNFRETEID